MAALPTLLQGTPAMPRVARTARPMGPNPTPRPRPCIPPDMARPHTAMLAVTQCTRRPRRRPLLVGFFARCAQWCFASLLPSPGTLLLTVRSAGGYGGGYAGGYRSGGYASTMPTGGSMGPAGPGEAPGVAGTSYKVPRGARYIGAEKETRDGKEVIIDRYAVPQRHVQQVGHGILYLDCAVRGGH